MPDTTTPPATVPLPTNIVEAKAQGPVVAGQLIIAPLAPISGPIPGKSGDFVTAVLKDFWENKTIVALRNAVLAAIGVAVFGVAMQVVTVNGDLSKIDWQTTQKLAIGATAFSLASAYAAWWKKRDNDPVK